ncbi:MAG: 6,7-dimethyl-8-ribityllumazine synthase [Acidobacteriota bacterium]|nr:6,7-dimethyl-8-ribityllumazine synthase [Acidobacteriota bacterium]
MIRSIIFPRVLGKSLDDLQSALDLFRALGFAPGNEWHEGGSHGVEMLAPSGGIEFIAAPNVPGVDAMVEVSDAELAYEIVKKLGENPHPSKGSLGGAPITIRREIADTPYGARLFEVETGGLRIGFLTYAKKPGATRGLEASLNAARKRFAIVVSRFNSFITERLLDGALQALRQCGAKSEDITIAHVPGSFEIPAAARQLAVTKKYNAILCIGCLLRGDTLHYEVIANEVTRGVGQSAQETGVPHAFAVLTCDTLQQAIDRAGLKSGNKGFEAGLAAVEMATLRDKVKGRRRRPRAEKQSDPGTPTPSGAGNEQDR